MGRGKGPKSKKNKKDEEGSGEIGQEERRSFSLRASLLPNKSIAAGAHSPPATPAHRAAAQTVLKAPGVDRTWGRFDGGLMFIGILGDNCHLGRQLCEFKRKHNLSNLGMDDGGLFNIHYSGEANTRINDIASVYALFADPVHGLIVDIGCYDLETNTTSPEKCAQMLVNNVANLIAVHNIGFAVICQALPRQPGGVKGQEAWRFNQRASRFNDALLVATANVTSIGVWNHFISSKLDQRQFADNGIDLAPEGVEEYNNSLRCLVMQLLVPHLVPRSMKSKRRAEQRRDRQIRMARCRIAAAGESSAGRTRSRAGF